VEAILLVGGKGTRLRPLTINTPKPMLPVAGVPFTAHQLAQAKAAGIERVILATSYKPEVFEDWLGDGSTLGLDVEYVTEEVPMGTGGAIRNAADRLKSAADEPVVIFNGDVLSGHNLRAQLAVHRDANADVTLYLTEVEDARAFGCVPTDEAGQVTAFLEKMPDPVTNRINAGCYVFERSIIDSIPAGRPVSVERETFPGLLAAGSLVMGYVDTAYWLDLGTPAAFVQGSRDLVLGRVISPAVPGPLGERLVLAGAMVDPSADVRGGSVISERAIIEEGAVVVGSVVQTGAVVKAGSVVLNSVLGRGSIVGERSVLDGVVVGDGAQVGSDCELSTGTRVWVNAVLPDKSIRLSSDQS
jgi:mannose-1-phosphate guanylyltransferase